jgi:peptide/nickel transport system ATP-binding protein
MSDPVLSVRGLCVDYATRRALDDVHLELGAGEGHAVVGISGSGKTTLARALARLVEPSSGSVLLDGEELTALSARRLRPMRRRIQMVFQEPQTSLDPRWRVGRSIAEPLRAAGVRSRQQRAAEVASLLHKVELSESLTHRFPHELSIGQQQRVAIARALAPAPQVLVCDEPVAALDPSVQADLAKLLAVLMVEQGLAIVLVTHHLPLASELCARTTVLDAGRVVETGLTDAILRHPQHARTRALVRAARDLEPPIA